MTDDTDTWNKNFELFLPYIFRISKQNFNWPRIRTDASVTQQTYGVLGKVKSNALFISVETLTHIRLISYLCQTQAPTFIFLHKIGAKCKAMEDLRAIYIKTNELLLAKRLAVRLILVITGMQWLPKLFLTLIIFIRQGL